MREKVGPVITLLLASLIIGCSIGFSARAGADTRVDDYASANASRICFVLNNFPNFAGVEGVADAIHNAGFTYYEAGVIEATAVYGVCPWHVPLLQSFIAYYHSPGPVYAAVGPMGGRIGG